VLLKRLESEFARFAFGLSAETKRRILRKPVRVDGLTLDPEIQLLLMLRKLRGGSTLRAETPKLARARMRAEILGVGGQDIALGAVRDFTIPGPHGKLPVRHYAPDARGEQHPLMVFFHGGGYVAGDLDTHDLFCRMMCRHAAVNVLAVDYRLAPEHPFPAAVDDAYAAFKWAASHTAELGADPARVAVCGDSAGGNLSAVVSMLATRDGGPTPMLQILIYPPADRSFDRASVGLFREGFLLEQADMQWYDDHYFGPSAAPRTDPRVSPIYADNLGSVAPALVFTAGFDPLRDEGEAFAAAMKAAGNRAELRRFDGLVHGFINMVNVSPVARGAVVEMATEIRRALG
jgi:acetyl esterase